MPTSVAHLAKEHDAQAARAAEGFPGVPKVHCRGAAADLVCLLESWVAGAEVGRLEVSMQNTLAVPAVHELQG